MCITEVSTTLQAELAKEVTDLRDQLQLERDRVRAANHELNQLFEAFQEALLAVEDEGTQSAIQEFLEEVTGREFHVTKAYRARITVEVTFRARSMEQAEDIELDVSLARFSELEDFEVEDQTVEVNED